MHDTPALDGIDRRRFLHLIGGVAAATLVAGCGADPVTESDALARPALVAALGAERVRDLGRRYRQMTASERDADSIADAIRGSAPWLDRFSRRAPRHVAQLVHDDFVAGRTVVVAGWILSVTEARQCALFSLLPV